MKRFNLYFSFFIFHFTFYIFASDLSDTFYKSGLFYVTSDYVKDKEGEGAIFLKAESLFFLGDYNRAYQAYSLLKEQSLDNENLPTIYYRIGDCLWFIGKKKEAIFAYKESLSKFPNNPQAPYAIFRTIQYYIEIGDYDTAVSIFSSSLLNYPDIPFKDSVFYLLGDTFERLKDYDRAILYYKKILETSSDGELRRNAMLSLARFYYERKDFESCIANLAKLTETQLSNNGYILLFSSYYNMKRFNEAISIFPKISSPTKELYLAYAESLYSLQRFDEATEAYVKGGGTGTGISYSYIKLGKLDLALKSINDDKSLYLIAQLGRDEQKVIAYEKIIEEYPKSGFREEAFLGLSLLYLKMGSKTSALNACNRMINEYPKSNLSLISLYNVGITFEDDESLLKCVDLYPQFPKNPEILYKIGTNMIKRNEYKGGLKLFSSLIEKYPESPLFPYSLYNLAFLHNKIGNPEKAAAIYRSIAPIDKDLGENALFYAGNISFNLKDYDRAIIDYQSIIKQYPKSSLIASSIYQIGWCYYKKEQFKDAAKWFTRLILHHKESQYLPSSLYWLAWCYFMEERYEEAKEAYLRLQREFPEHPLSDDGCIRIGLCFYNQGKYKEAIEQYQRLIEKSQDKALIEEALYQIGEAFIIQNKTGEAINYYKLFLEKSPDEKLNKSIRTRLAELYYSSGKKDKAREEYKKLLQEELSDEKKADVCYWIGRTFLPDSKNDAIFYFRKVSELYPQSKWAPDALFRIGVIFYSSNNYKNAISTFKTLIKDYKDREDLIKEAKGYITKMEKK